MYLRRTDLAVESTAQFENNLPHGVKLSSGGHGDAMLTRVEITTDEAAQEVGRAKGRYITINMPAVEDSVDTADDVTQLVVEELTAMLPKEGAVLVVGLGNAQMTPDALGPKAVQQIIATRHIPKQVTEQTGLDHLRCVASIAPGVLGQTGIETWEVVQCIIKELQPAAVIAIDALAAHSLSRLGSTIQISDSGISPGSGVLNSRKELSQATLGVPVISIGIPTVVDGGTLAIDLLGFDDTSKVPKEAYTTMVTPRDIDAIIERGAKHLSLAINAALQPDLSMEEITYLIS